METDILREKVLVFTRNCLDWLSENTTISAIVEGIRIIIIIDIICTGIYALFPVIAALYMY